MENENSRLISGPPASAQTYEDFGLPTPPASSFTHGPFARFHSTFLNFFHFLDNSPASPSTIAAHTNHNHELQFDPSEEISPQNFVTAIALGSRAAGEGDPSKKLKTIEGVYLPTWLSMWGILVFVRLGYCLGQAGLLETSFMFIFAFLIDLLTTLSISAIGTNGTVKGGGPYFMISRTLGVEFGGSIGIIYCFGNILGNAMNVFGFLEPLLDDFALGTGRIAHILPTGSFWNFTYGACLLIISTLFCSFGSKNFAKTTVAFFFVMVFCTGFMIISFLAVKPFNIPGLIDYTSWNTTTFEGNIYPAYTIGPGPSHVETFSSIFGILYPSCTGILAGASMSGDLKDPGRSIPAGTLSAIGSSFFLYMLLTIFISATVARDTLITNFTFLSQISISPSVIKLAIYSSALFSIVGGILTTAKVLQAMARDRIIPSLTIFGKGKGSNDEPIMAIFFVLFLSILLLFVGDLNKLMPFLTMLTLLSYGIINFACFLLKIASAPNFRPSFVYFHWTSALLGFISCIIAMFIVSGMYASVSIVFLVFIWIGIHFVSPPKAWGEIQQGLIYHQVRKYLLRLDIRKEHVKFWRPQILLINSPSNAPFPLIQFANSMKKGSLFIIAEIIVANENKLDISKLRKRRLELMDFVDSSRVKAFTEVILSKSWKEGARSLMMTCGLGGMKPNILLMPWKENEDDISIEEYLDIIEDALDLGKSVAVARGFSKLVSPRELSSEYGWFSKTGWKKWIFETPDSNLNGFIDLYPLLMVDNYNTYMMVLQLGCILNMVQRWKVHYKLRVIGIVEMDDLIEQEREKLVLLLADLRIRATILVVSLQSIGVARNFDLLSSTAEDEASKPVFSIPQQQTRSEGIVITKPTIPGTQAAPVTSFNDISFKEQVEILNRIFRVYSHPDRTAVIMSSLISPRHCSKEIYMEALSVFSRGAGEEDGISIGLPPMLMIYGQGVVVTKNL